MFRLIKLGFYVLLGYALYELYQGMKAESGSRGGSGMARAGGGRSRRSRAGQFTGAEGSGMSEVTQEAGGTSQRHQVGRGVI